jgi:hypothetical protein
MSLDISDINAIEDVVKSIKGNIERDDNLEEKALEDFKELWIQDNKGSVEGIGMEDECLKSKKKEELDNNQKEKYGIDASITQVIKLKNNIKMCISIAKADVKWGNEKYSNLSFIEFTIYDPMNNIKGELKDKNDNNNVNINIQRINSEDIKIDDMNDSLLMNISRTQSESKLLKKIVDNENNCIIYLDGCLIPKFLINKLLTVNNLYNVRSKNITEEVYSNIIGSIIRRYIKSIEKSNKNNIKIIGIAKTSYSETIVNSIRDKKDKDNKFWSKDRVLIYNLLEKDKNLRDIRYTEWVKYKKDLPKNSNEINIFKPIEDKLEMSIDMYQRCWFYFYENKTKTLRRVETNYNNIRNRYDREELQKTIVRDMFNNKGSPSVVDNADKKANISKKRQDRIKRKISKNIMNDYNIDERGEDYNKEI